MELAAKVIFWSSAAALLYTYVGYPALVWAVSRLRPRPVRRAECEPHVTVVITAYNEERDLSAKLENTLALEYPKDKLEIIVASDCSTDRTDEIARRFAARGVRLHRQPVRLGKTAAQNAAVELARGEIILFSDATTLYRADVLRAMLPNFADASVGCVAGKLIYVDSSGSAVGRGAKSYWGYETFLKVHESRACSLIGASGCLYAVRRAAYVPLYHEACSDFIIATKMVEQGLRAVYEPEAVCTEETNRRADKEMRMRVRVIAQTYGDLWRHRALMNPMRGGFYSVELLSHKVMRYLVPALLVLVLVSSALLAARSWFFAALLAGQVLFYAAALAGWLLERAGVRNRLLALPHYFVLANLAALVAFYKFARGERYARWEPIREPAATPPLGAQAATTRREGGLMTARSDETAAGGDRTHDRGERASGGGGGAAPRVSVIMPAYNVSQYIGEALESVFAQTFTDYEVIVINDGSPDTAELERTLEPYGGRIVYLKQENRGVSAARNTGIRAARGEFVAHLDPDDLWEPVYLAAQLAEFERDPTLDIVYPNALIFGDAPEAGLKFMDWCASEGEVTVESLFRQRCHVMCSVTARREVLVRAGLFDEELRCSEDFDLWLRVLKGGGRIGYQRRVLARYRRRAASHTSDTLWLSTSLLRVLDKAERTLELTPPERAALDEMRRGVSADLDLQEGKSAFFRGDVEAALPRLRAANEHLRSRKLALVIFLLRLAPRWLRRAYDLRERLDGRAGAKLAGGR